MGWQTALESLTLQPAFRDSVQGRRHRTALKFAAFWMCAGGADLATRNPDKVKGVRFETDKSLFRLRTTSTNVKSLLLALQAGTISYPTFYDALQGAGLAREGVTAEDERKPIEQYGEQFA